MDRDKMSNLYKGLSIDASYQVSVHLDEGYQRRRLKCEKVTDAKCDSHDISEILLKVTLNAITITLNQI
jgi:hypothetical protein